MAPRTAERLTQPEPNPWRGIRLVSAYRVFLSVGLVGVSLSDLGGHLFSPADSYQFAFFAWIYLATALLLEGALELRILPFRAQAHIHASIDLLFLNLLAFAAGGPEGPLSLLLIIAVGMAAALLGGRAAVGYAALGTLLALGVALGLTFWTEQTPPYTGAGFLGAALFMMAVLVNTLERRTKTWQQHSQAREREAHYRSALALRIIEQSDDGMIISQPDGQIEYINQAALALLHPSKAQAARYQNDRLDEQHPLLADTLNQWWQQPEKSRFDFDEPHRFRATLHHLNTELGPRALIVLLDLSAEDERVQRDKLAALGRLIASIAHEVRNPLSSIRQAADLLPGAQDQQERSQLTEIITRQTERINRLVEDVLQAARTPQVHAEAIELTPWLQRFIDQQQALFAAQHVNFEFSAPTTNPVVWFDRVHLEQILTNLVTNAINHQPKSAQHPPTIRLFCHNTATGRVVLEVCDQNPLIPLETRSAMFEPFFTTHQAGTGLGLFIARELTEANEARLSWQPANDHTQHGNCFTLDLKPATDTPDND